MRILGEKKPKTALKNEYNVPLSHNAIKTTVKSNILFILEKRISKKNIDGFLSHLSSGHGFMMQE